MQEVYAELAEKSMPAPRRSFFEFQTQIKSQTHIEFSDSSNFRYASGIQKNSKPEARESAHAGYFAGAYSRAAKTSASNHTRQFVWKMI